MISVAISVCILVCVLTNNADDNSLFQVLEVKHTVGPTRASVSYRIAWATEWHDHICGPESKGDMH